MSIHKKTVAFLNEFLKTHHVLPLSKDVSISYFKSGAGTHLYLISSNRKKYLARVNYYPNKNEWGVKEQEYKILKLIESTKIAPQVYYVNKKNRLKQHFTIVDFIEGKDLKKVTDVHVVSLAKSLKKLHSTFTFKKSGNTLPPKDALPYICDIYNTYSEGEDKKIEKYIHLEGIKKVTREYNRIKDKLGVYFTALNCFNGITKFSLIHGDLKKENIIDTGRKLILVDWECGGSDIPEMDIGNVFAGCKLSKKHQNLFLKTYYKKIPDTVIIERIYAIKKVLDFFGIMDDYILQKRKKWDAKKMKEELLEFERANL